MKKIFFLFFVSAFLLLTSEIAYAQRTPKRKGQFDSRSSRWRGERQVFPKSRRYTSVGLSLNALNYFGDLAPEVKPSSTDLLFTRPGIGIFATRKYGERFFMRGSFSYGRLRGDDFKSADPLDNDARFRYVRNNHFRNDIKELSVVGMFEFFHNRRTYQYREKWSPYLFGGLAVFHHNPKAMAPYFDLQGNPLEEGGKWVDLKPLGTEGQYSPQYDVRPYSNFQISIPAGVGIKYRWKETWDIAFEIGYRHLFFDQIDDTSGDYVNLDALGGDLARAMSFRGKEENAVYYNRPRDFVAIDGATTNFTYEGPDGKVYNVYRGFGVEGRDNIRGNIRNNDIYFQTSIQLIYILPQRTNYSKYRR